MAPGAGHWFNKLINEGEGFLTLDLPLPSPCLKSCVLHQGLRVQTSPSSEGSRVGKSVTPCGLKSCSSCGLPGS